MRNVRVDENGEFRCWKCGGKNFTLKRTFRSKVLVGVGALLTKKKLKCHTCGEFNDTGSAKPYTTSTLMVAGPNGPTRTPILGRRPMDGPRGGQRRSDNGPDGLTSAPPSGCDLRTQ